MAMVFCKQRFDFVHKTTIEKLKKTFQKLEHSKKYVLLPKCIEKCGAKRKILSIKARKISQENLTSCL